VLDNLYCSVLPPQSATEADFLFFSLRQTLYSTSPHGISSARFMLSSVRKSVNRQKKQCLLHPQRQGIVSFSHNGQVSISDTIRYPSGVYFFPFKTKRLLCANDSSFHFEKRTSFFFKNITKKLPDVGSLS
jgi:hypothetical protein